MLNRMIQAFQALGDTRAYEAAEQANPNQRKAIEGVIKRLMTKLSEGNSSDFHAALITKLTENNIDTAAFVAFKNICEALSIDYLNLIKSIYQKHDVLLKEYHRTCVSLSGYELCVVTDEVKPEPNKLYLRKKDDKIVYTVITPNGEIVYDIQLKQRLHANALDNLTDLVKVKILEEVTDIGHIANSAQKKEYEKKNEVPNIFGADDIVSLLFRLLPQSEEFCKKVKYFCAACPTSGMGELSYYLTVLESYADYKINSAGLHLDEPETPLYITKMYDSLVQEMQQPQQMAHQPTVLSVQSLQSLITINKILEDTQKRQEKAAADAEAQRKAEKQKSEAAKAAALEKQKKAAEKHAAYLESILESIRKDYLDLLDTYECDMDNEFSKKPELHTFLYSSDRLGSAANRNRILQALESDATPEAPAIVEGESVEKRRAKLREHAQLTSAHDYVQQNEVLKKTIVKLRATRHVLSATNLKKTTAEGKQITASTQEKLIETEKRINFHMSNPEVIACRDSRFMNVCKRALVKIASVVGLGKKLENWLFYTSNSVQTAGRALKKIKKANPAGLFSKQQNAAPVQVQLAAPAVDPQQVEAQRKPS